MKRRSHRVVLICPVCGEPVLRDGRRFCSRTCAVQSEERRYRGEVVYCEPPPTPQEIAERAAEIRAEWTDEVRIDRMRPDHRPLPWVVPSVTSAQ
ncbi:MAG: hypothetical protein SH850_05460 [Planctomycetaceae bacterium]|nr:hypothetical protein [Planctomycetaceae bacterium]